MSKGCSSRESKGSFSPLVNERTTRKCHHLLRILYLSGVHTHVLLLLGVHFLSLYESRVVSSSSGVASRRPPLQAQRLRDFGEATEAEEAERSTSKSAVKEVGSSIALKPPRQSF